jgi:tetratricopeptide (TPR) repeat protein
MLLAAGFCSMPSVGLAMQTGGDAAPPDVVSGLRLMQRGDFAAAKLRFSAAIRANPKSADALTWRGITENELKQFREAEHDFDAALSIEPGDLPARYNLALSLIRLGEHDRALEQLREVVRLKPGAPEAEYNLAILLEERQATSEAIEHLKAAYKARPDDASIQQHLAADLVAAGRVEEAQPMLDRLRPADSSATLRQTAESLLEAGHASQAVQLLETAHQQMQPNTAQATTEIDTLLARAYIADHQDAKAIELLAPAAGTDQSGGAAYLLGLAYLDMGTTLEAKEAFARAAKANPRNGTALYHLAILESGWPNERSSAIVHLRAAVQTDPDNVRFGVALARLLLETDDAHGALPVLEHLHPTGREAGERDLLLGVAQIIVNGPGQAIPALERAVTEDPGLALSFNMLGFCYFTQGDMNKAAQAYAAASDLSPQTRLFAHSAAVAYDRANDAQSATSYAARAVALPEANDKDYELYGKLLANAGKRDDAIRELQQAVALNPHFEEAYFLLGRTYMQAGNNAQATEWFDKLKQVKQANRTAGDAAARAPKPAASTLLQGAPAASPDTP